MSLEALLVQLNTANLENKSLVLNDTNAYAVGLNISEVRSRFYREKGRVLLTNEDIKVGYDKEGGNFDFSTFDGVSIRVPYNYQDVAPNKGGDGFER